jgi:hypothetical protein
MKSSLPLKPLPSIAPPIESAPVKPIERSAAPAAAPRPRGVTGRVPDVARSPRPKRTRAELLDEARKVTAEWPEARITAEGIRREVRTSPANARTLRDTLLAERAEAA